MTDHDAIAARVRQDRETGTPGPWQSGIIEDGGPFAVGDRDCWPICKMAAAPGPHNGANARRIAALPDLEAAYLDLYDEVQRLRAERDRLRTQCCMCGKTGLSTIEDGGPECELDDGRWVCSVDCYDRAVLNYDRAVLNPLVAEAERDRLRVALLKIAEYLPSFDYVARDEFGKCTDLPGSPYDRGKADASAHLSAIARAALKGSEK